MVNIILEECTVHLHYDDGAQYVMCVAQHEAAALAAARAEARRLLHNNIPHTCTGFTPGHKYNAMKDAKQIFA